MGDSMKLVQRNRWSGLGALLPKVFSIIFLSFLFLLSGPVESWSKDEKSASAKANGSNSSSTAIEKFLSETLKVEDPSRFLLTLKLRKKLENGFAGQTIQPFSPDGKITGEGHEALLKLFSKQSAKTIEKLILTLGRSEYNNSMLIGPAGVGKTFLIHQLVAILSYGVTPEYLNAPLGIENPSSPFLNQLREAYFGKTQIVSIDYDLLSRDNTRSGQAFAKSDVRMRSLLIDIVNAAKQDFLENKTRTVFILEEVATLPELVQQTLKSLLDETGFKTDSSDTIEKGAEIGFSVIGVTTPGEYREMIGNDSAVERRYEHAFIFEPTEAEALEILMGKRDQWSKRYGLNIEEDVLSYLISMRKFFSNPPLAMPHSVLKVVDGLLLWCSNPSHRRNGDNITMDEAYEYLVRQAHLPLHTWLPQDDRAPLHNLAERVKTHVVGHDEIIEQIARRLKTGRVNGFRDFPVFIIMGPSGSGKDTLLRAFNLEMFGHDGHHLKFDVARSHSQGLRAILEGGTTPEGELPLLLSAMNEVSPNGIIGLNEIKDLPSQEFDRLKSLMESGIIQPRGHDKRSRPLGLNGLFLMGQYGEELFVGKSEKEIQDILENLTEEKLIDILEAGSKDGKAGAIPYAVIQRAIRSGGIFILPPLPTHRYQEIVQLSLKSIIQDLKVRSHIDLIVDDSLVQEVARIASTHNKGTRGLEGILMDLTNTAVSEALDQNPKLRNTTLRLSAGPDKSIVVEQIENNQTKAVYRLLIQTLLRFKCSNLLGANTNPKK